MNACRIAYLTADAGIPPDSAKGASVHFRELARAFARLGVPLDVFLAREGDVSGFRPHRAQTVPTPRAPGLVGEVVQLCHNEAMLAALQESGPHAAVYERLSLFGAAGLAHAHALGVPFAVEVNAPLWREAAAYRSLHLREAGRGVCLDTLRLADRVFVVSRALGDELAEAGVSPERIEVLGNGADLARFRNATPAPKPPALVGRPTLVFLGSMKPWHGVGFLLTAFAALRRRIPCGLWIVGDGPERDAVAAAARAMPHDIVWSGAVGHEEVPAILAAADLTVAPYTALSPAYFSPLKIVEALAAGSPLLASRVPCVLETLRDFRPRGLFEADDVDDFVRAAEDALRNPEPVPASLIEDLDWTSKAARIARALRVDTGAMLHSQEVTHG
jgi:glycosyltransferase involved in cell wall biosynthesis